MYLRIDDNNPNLDTGKSANARGYEAMTDVDTGTGLFPTTAQMTNGVFINKSNASDSTARPWVLVGDGFEFHLFYVCNSTTYPGIYRQFHFGDPAPEMASDPYGCLIYGDTAAYIGAPDFNQTTHLIVTAATGGIQAGHYFARLYSQTGAAIPAGKNGNVAMGSATIGVGNMAYPAPHNNGLYLSPLFVQDITVLRSQLKGAWQPLHTRPLGHGGTVSAANSPIGRRLYAVATAYSSGTSGETHIDIDGPWR